MFRNRMDGLYEFFGDFMHARANARLLRIMRRQYDTLKDESYHDPMTGLFNKVFLDEWISGTFPTLRESGVPVSVAMADVDHFKEINDTLGHPEGDQILLRVGEFMRKNTRGKYDLPIRRSGDEFFIVLPETDVEGAGALSYRVCREISKMPVRPPATVSFGVAQYLPCVDARSFENTIARAEESLYVQKRRGGNGVTLYPNCSFQRMDYERVCRERDTSSVYNLGTRG